MLFEKTLEKRKFLIEKLISRGIYKKDNTHLYELSLRDLEEEDHKTRSLKDKIDTN